jgi:trehalose 6-phosphate phosphatase
VAAESADRRTVNRTALFAAFVDRPDDSTVLLDFDGTLAPMVSDPSQAVAIAGAADKLKALGDAGLHVGVISGRPLSFLDEVCPDVPMCVGLYGLERRVDGVVTRHPDYDQWASVLGEALESGHPDGVRVEMKGPSATLHYRERPDAEPAARLFAAQLERHGLIVRDARQSIELHPPIDVNKGTAVRDLVGGCVGPVMFAGDDLGDLAAFDALDAFRAEARPVVKVTVASSESPEEMLSRADVVVAGPEGLTALLGELLAALNRS